ncbi:MAG: hypothetical protein J2P23_13735 [Microlunatus sp.]|nr:hypothetical protein [Microlunatus sp.]
MDANNEFRLALGERADKVGLILSQVGTTYRLAPQDPSGGAETVFESADLTEVERYLARIEQG